MAEFDAAAAKSAGYTDAEIAKVQQGITSARAAGYSDAEIQGFLARTGGRVDAGQPAQPSETPLSVPGTAAALGRGAAPYVAGGAIGSVVPGVGTAAGLIGTGAWELGGTIWNAVGLPHVLTPQEITDKGFDAMGVQRPGNWLERGAMASGGLIASTGLAPPTPKTTGGGTPQQQQLLRDFDQHQVPSSVPAVGQGSVAGMAQNLGKRLPISGNIVQKGIERQFGATSEAAARQAGEYGTDGTSHAAGQAVAGAVTREVQRMGSEVEAVATGIGTRGDAFEAGATTRNALKRFAADSSQAAADYGRFYGLMQGAPPVNLTNTNALLDDLMGQFPSAPALEGLMAPAPIARARDALAPQTQQIPAKTSAMLDQFGNPIVTSPAQTVQRGGTLTWPELQKLRTHIGYQLENPSIGPDTIPRGALKRLYEALTQDMEIAAQARGPEAVKALKRATGNYNVRMQMIDRLEPLLTGQSPERTFSKLNSAALTGGAADAGLLRTAKQNMSPAEWGDVGATIVDRLGQPRPGAADPFTTPNGFSPAAFATSWSKLSNQAKDIIYGPARRGTPRAALEDLARQATGRQGLVDLVSGKSGEQVYTALNNAASTKGGANSALVKDALAVMSPQERGDFAATVIARLGEPLPGEADILQRTQFSPSTFMTRWNSLSDSAKDLMFGPKGSGGPRDALDSLTRVVQAEKNVEKLANTSRSAEYVILGSEIMGGLQAAGYAATGGSKLPLGVWAAMAGSSYPIGKLLVSPDFARRIYGASSGRIVTPGFVARSGMNAINAATAPGQSSKTPDSPTDVSGRLGMQPAAGASPAGLF